MKKLEKVAFSHFFDTLYFVGSYMVHTGQKNVTMLRSAVLTKYFMLKF